MFSSWFLSELLVSNKKQNMHRLNMSWLSVPQTKLSIVSPEKHIVVIIPWSAICIC